MGMINWSILSQVSLSNLISFLNSTLYYQPITSLERCILDQIIQ